MTVVPFRQRKPSPNSEPNSTFSPGLWSGCQPQSMRRLLSALRVIEATSHDNCVALLRLAEHLAAKVDALTVPVATVDYSTDARIVRINVFDLSPWEPLGYDPRMWVGERIECVAHGPVEKCVKAFHESLTRHQTVTITHAVNTVDVHQEWRGTFAPTACGVRAVWAVKETYQE